MRLLLLLVGSLLCLPVAALDNSKTVYNQTAEAQSGRAITLHWYLAKGEISGYPRPYVNPSDTQLRQPAAAWQADVKSRWRDAARARAITGVRTAAPSWSTGTGLVRIVESSDTSTITFSAAHGLHVGDRLLISGATVDKDLNRDHYSVVTTPSPTTVTVRTQDVTDGTYTDAGLTVKWVIDPSAVNYCRIAAPGHRLEVSDEVVVAGVAGVNGINGTWRVTATAQDEFLINTTCTGAYQGGGSVTGPDFGSVRTALVSFVSDVPASGSLKVDVVNSADACHLGGEATCREAGLDPAGMLAFGGGTWDARLQLTATVKSGSTGQFTRSARAMLGVWDGVESYCGPRYWQRGPVVTQMLVEYGCENGLTQDLGWKIVNGRQLAEAITTTAQTQFAVVSAAGLEVGSRLWFFGTSSNIEHMRVEGISGNVLTVTRATDGTTAQSYASGKYVGVMQWEDSPDAGTTSIHPSFALTFLSGWSGVRIETRVENVYWNKQQGLWYAVEIQTGTPGVTRMSRTEMKHAARTRWRKTFWSGPNAETWCEGGSGTDADDCAGTGGGSRALVYRVDHNADYLIYAGALPAWEKGVATSTLPWWSTVGNPNYGFSASDRGDIGVARRKFPDQATATPAFPLKYLGMGTWGADSYGNWYAEKDFQNGTQEGWPMPRAMATWVQSWDKWGYDLLLGTSLPGGGGNSAVESYIPYLAKEDGFGRGAYVLGWSDGAVGRWVSTHNRASIATSIANYYVSTAKTTDTPRVACWSAANTVYSSAILTQAGQWPCWHIGVQGFDSWNFELAHMNDWSWTAWLVTGEDWHWQTMMAKAAFAAGFAHAAPIGRNIGKVWAYSQMNDHIRQESWGTQAMVHALSAAPTELLHGQSSTPERNLLLAQLWDGVMFAEGLMAQQDGWAATLYAPTFTTNCAGYTSLLGDVGSADRYRFGRCTMGAAQNALGYFPAGLTAAGACSGEVYMDCTKASYAGSLWMLSYSNVVWHRSLDLGFPGYEKARRVMGRMALNMTLNKDFNGYLFGYYRGPTVMAASGTLPQSWAEWKKGYTPAAQTVNSWPEVGGSTPLPIGYSYRLLSILSYYTDLTDNATAGCDEAKRRPVGCTGSLAYAWFKQTAINQDQAKAGELKYYLQPRPLIQDVRQETGSGEAVVRYTAPFGGGCHYRLSGSGDGDSLDGNDQADQGAGRARRVELRGLQPGTDYWLRLTCGQARLTEKVRTLVTAGLDSATLRLRAPAACGSSCQVRVEYSDDGAAWTALAPRACSTTCNLSIPAGAQRVKQVRYTYYSDELGTALFAGPARMVMLVR